MNLNVQSELKLLKKYTKTKRISIKKALYILEIADMYLEQKKKNIILNS